MGIEGTRYFLLSSMRCWPAYGGSKTLLDTEERAQIPIRRLLAATEAHSQALMATCESRRKRRKWEEELNILQKAANPPMHNMQ